MLAQDRKIGQWNKIDGMTECDKVSKYLGKITCYQFEQKLKSYTPHTFTKK